MNTALSPKVTIAALAAAIATIIVWIFRDFTGVDVPALVEGAFIVVLTFAGGYLKGDPARTNRIVEGS